MIAQNGSKNIMSITIGIALLILSNHALSADNNADKDNYWAERAEHLRQELFLTEEQTIKIQHILENIGEVTSANSSNSPNAFDAPQKTAGHGIWNEIYSILNNEQRRKYEQLHPAKDVAGQNKSIAADAKFVSSGK